MKRKLLTYLLLLLSPYFILAQNKTKVYFVEFKGEREITANPIKQYEGKSNNEKPITIRIYSEISFQTMEGIGGAFNEIGGEALMSLPEDQRNEVIKNLFYEDGAGFTYCRTAVGASDFGIDAYSYSEVEGDYKMKKFSIKREKTTLLPYIQMAYKYNPTLKLFASPWSPPGWMKESGFMDGKGDKSKLIDKPEIYQAYALYLSKYIQAYAKEGIQINRLMIQNEQDATTKYPSNYMPPSEMGNFVIDYLRPQFNQDKISTEIWAGTFRTAKKLGVLEFVTNTKWRESVKGIGIQYTTSDQIMNIKTLYPEVQLFHTEGHCHGGENSIKHAFDRFDEIASYVNYGVSNFCYWNMILNETSKSGWGWKQNSLININRENKKVTYNPDYAALALFSKFIRPGMQRIASTFQHHKGKNTMTFIDLEKNITVFLKNESDKPVTYNLKIDDKQSKLVDIPANSLAAVQIRRK
jgi:glucosylceramidase